MLGIARSTIYNHIDQGLLPHPVHIGPHAVAWVADEISSVVAARIAEKSDDEIRELVKQLERNRRDHVAGR